MCWWLQLSAALGGILLGGLAHSEELNRAGVTVFAAASLTETVQELADAYQKQTGIVVRTSFASSGTLARQIDAGAQSDIFISADVDWMDTLERRHLIVAGTRHTLVTNRLVLIASADSALHLKLGPGAPRGVRAFSLPKVTVRTT